MDCSQPFSFIIEDSVTILHGTVSRSEVFTAADTIVPEKKRKKTAIKIAKLVIAGLVALGTAMTGLAQLIAALK